MKVYLENIKANQGLLELYRILSKDNYEMLDDIENLEEGLLLTSKLFFSENKTLVETTFVRNKIVLKKIVKDVEKIDVKIDNIKKKIDVALKQSLLEIMEVELPWGILTGIRPTKIVHKLMDEQLEENEIYRILKDEYLIRLDKLELLIEVCKGQRSYLEESRGKYSIYIGIPFCPSRCLYCSFTSLNINREKHLVNNYIKTLVYELEKTEEMMQGKTLNTIYIGGGTPTSLEREDLEFLLENIRRIFPSMRELTVEAGRPDTLNEEYLKMFVRQKVDRISINPQTMNDETLKVIGRNHTRADIVDIYRQAKELGLKSINMDLIVGLPGEKYEDVKKTLKEISILNPDNLTIHSLSLKTNSLFAKVVDEYETITDCEAEEISDLIDAYTKKMELKPYYLYRQKHIAGNLENIGYGRQDSLCLYNISMMEERETVIGIGVGSVSKIVNQDRIKRVPSFKSIDDYISRIDELIERKKTYL